jgi:hypothetical protein
VAREWRGLVAGMTNVQKLVHSALQLDPFDEESIRTELLQMRREAYEAELNDQARRVGCPGRSAHLRNGPILGRLDDDSREDAASIVNTYNYDLAVAILAVDADAPAAGRNVYARRLRDWEAKRNAWKGPLVEQYTRGSARGEAQRDFHRLNERIAGGGLAAYALPGWAELQPKSAVCPICIGWVARGRVPLEVAMDNPANWHPNCPHWWDVHPRVFSADECALLWMGEE